MTGVASETESSAPWKLDEERCLGSGDGWNWSFKGHFWRIEILHLSLDRILLYSFFAQYMSETFLKHEMKAQLLLVARRLNQKQREQTEKI